MPVTDTRTDGQSPGKRAWFILRLVAGYPFAFVVLLTSGWPPVGFWQDLKGERGREIALDWGESILLAFILAMFVRTFFFQPFLIPSGSMRMTLVEGDRLFVNKLDYGAKVPLTSLRLPGFAKPQRGDVVVFRYPVTKDKDFIKRLIAFGGETVEIRGGTVVIDGKPVLEGPLARRYYYNRGDFGAQGRPVLVPEGQYFVLGDNSLSSHDSRYWGFVPQDLVIGKASLLFWPLDRIKWIK
jgi:signal peptidase I